MVLDNIFVGRRNKGGFTLIELLLVISIISLLSTIILASLNTARLKARDANRLATIQNVKLALEFYADDNGDIYPPARNSGGGEISDGSGSSLAYTVQYDLSGYISGVPEDPLSAYSYQYVRRSSPSGYGIRIYHEGYGDYCKTGVNILSGWWGSGTLVCEDAL